MGPFERGSIRETQLGIGIASLKLHKKSREGESWLLSTSYRDETDCEIVAPRYVYFRYFASEAPSIARFKLEFMAMNYLEKLLLTIKQ